ARALNWRPGLFVVPPQIASRKNCPRFPALIGTSPNSKPYFQNEASRFTHPLGSDARGLQSTLLSAPGGAADSVTDFELRPIDCGRDSPFPTGCFMAATHSRRSNSYPGAFRLALTRALLLGVPVFLLAGAVGRSSGPSFWILICGVICQALLCPLSL